jgi:CorA-like Mg2+ transporter protein
MDSGKDLDRGLPGPWNVMGSDTDTGGFELLPVIRKHPRIAFQSSMSTQKAQKLAERAAAFQQSRALLNLDYGRHFDNFEVFEDAFYAAEPLFKFKACAEAQFLNLVESEVLSVLSKKLDAMENSPTSLEALNNLADFVFHKELLESHAQGLKENIQSIENRDAWPKRDNTNPKVNDSAIALLKDYKWLYERTKELSAACDRGMKDIHNKSMLAESIGSNKQAQAVEALTRLTTIISVFYIPLSFTTSFFGMNFSLFGQGHQPLWLWAAVSLPVVILSFITYFLFQPLRRSVRATSDYLKEISQVEKKSHTEKD